MTGTELAQWIANLKRDKECLDRCVRALTDMLMEDATKPRRGRKFLTDEERKEVSERMKRYWADRKKAPAMEIAAPAGKQRRA